MRPVAKNDTARGDLSRLAVDVLAAPAAGQFDRRHAIGVGHYRAALPAAHQGRESRLAPDGVVLHVAPESFLTTRPLALEKKAAAALGAL